MSAPLLGHERIREQLARSADADTLHHAYLFEGPPGLGKRRVAMWLAQYVNCTSANRPCGTCSRCVQIAAGTHPDVIVLSPDPTRATQTIAVDAVREVIRKAGYHRYDSARRFIVVDPADAMMEPAANALLKTLEEPTDGTGFVLVVSSASSLLPTIVSRCQRVRFGAVDTGAIEGWLAAQGLSDASVAARAALGCPGRALALATGGLEARRDARSTLVRITSEPLPVAFKVTEDALKKKAKTDWSSTVDAWFAVVEELLRDASIHGSGSGLPLLNQDAPDVVAAWSARLYPSGIQRVAQALDVAREQLAVQANGRLVIDAFFATLRAELGV
ncbi:MAG: DNA polymerase III subunit delta' [Alphaproteobacteria bacterium]|nr:DNA polymerase III subunit delta' [Myxococcales bacterium]MCB9671964.1 DNA polymerase III subunit delta' [Alphaproteobacteria bacterium]MCB9692722.1 DNA polymerase III subunit delta' [Alphaproteobacteria bacterium]